MININSTQDLRLPLFYIWLILMLYAFYKYYKNTDFKNISLKHFMLASFIIFWCGYITCAMFFGIEHLHLLPFMPFGILILVRWCELNPIGVIAGCLIPSALLLAIYRLVIKPVKKYLILYAVLIIFLWFGLFYGGVLSFLYVLSRFIF